jgi:hypothetical protein
MKVIILNPKGGVGKTFFALNVAIPFFHSKGIKKINYIRLSGIPTPEIKSLGIIDLKVLRINPKTIKGVQFPENAIIEVGPGGNLAEGMRLLINGLKEEKIVFVIPLKNDIESADLAFKTYQGIDLLFGKQKVVFALSEVRFKEHYTKEFPVWFGEPDFGFSGYDGRIKEIDRNYFVVPYNTEVNTIRIIGSYIPYEFYLKHKDTIVEEYRNAKTEKEKQKVISRKALLQGIEEFLEETKPYYSLLEVK